MTYKIKGVDVEKYAFYVNKLRQNVGLETSKWRQTVTSQTAHTKYKWPPYDPEPKPPPWKFSAYATDGRQLSVALLLRKDREDFSALIPNHSASRKTTKHWKVRYLQRINSFEYI